MNTTKKLSKLIANIISDFSTNIANKSTSACVAMLIEEPKMPKALFKKAK